MTDSAPVIACLVRTRERFMGIGQILTMPLFFASSAVYPISVMPEWLKAVAQVNPLTYRSTPCADSWSRAQLRASRSHWTSAY